MRCTFAGFSTPRLCTTAAESWETTARCFDHSTHLTRESFTLDGHSGMRKIPRSTRAQLLIGDPSPIRDIGLLGSAVARPQTTVFGDDAYPDLWTKAAAVLDSIVNNHALIDGNKRLGWLATAVFLEINDIPVEVAANDDIYRLVIDVATGDAAVDQIAVRLRQLSRVDDG